ncbi:MAG: flagellar biosynthesis protein FlaG [Sulfolobaceae archaeon]|nr:flagellar biosynthesis protein FlaG [Sulfolobaceae archaeon]
MNEAIEESIFIIASVILIGLLAGIVYSVVSSLGTSFSSFSIAQAQRLVTDVQIDYATNTSSTTVVFYLHNVGETTIFNLPSSTLYFGPQGDLSIIGYGSGTSYWTTNTQTLYPGQVAEITIHLSTQLVQNQYYTIEFVTPNGYEVTYTFQVI